MPNRILKESVKYSDQIDQLTWFEEVVFYRLIISADDYGCVDGRSVLLKNELFPTKETVTKRAVEEAIEHLASVGLLCKYTASGKPYLALPTWERHQRVRNKHRKFPAPPQEALDIHLTADCGQMTADCQPESESNPNPNPNKNPNPNAHTRAEVDAAFEAFWDAYPRKAGKKTARVAFEKVSVDLGTLLSAIEQQKHSRQWQEDGGKYIPLPATWLNQERWEDELPTGESSEAGTGNAFFDLLAEGVFDNE